MITASSSRSRSGLYVHIPFCVAKCCYCDFCSFAGTQSLYEPYLGALLKQIACAGADWPGPLFDTLYIGGGTPTVLAASELGSIIQACFRYLGLQDDAEITCEANPGTVSARSLVELKEAGLGRLSLGVQSLDDELLRILGRIHDRQAVFEAVAAARAAGIENINLDLIYGVPLQTLAAWRRTLEEALALNPEHLSLYALTLEPGTPMDDSVRCGALPEPDDELVADMYILAQEALAAHGYAQYEISNWARTSRDDVSDREPLLASRHNLHYWHNERYLGLGSAAHSFDGSRRYARCADPAEFVRRVSNGEDTVEMSEQVARDLEMDETMMLGLRLMQGVTWKSFEARFGEDLRSVYSQALEQLRGTGLVIIDATGVRLAPRAFLVGNRVFAEFLRSTT
ncbi:MAG: radical SAM family heme chaperone HemW [Anaerolineae bacterium]